MPSGLLWLECKWLHISSAVCRLLQAHFLVPSLDLWMLCLSGVTTTVTPSYNLVPGVTHGQSNSIHGHYLHEILF